MANYIGNIPSTGEFKKLDSIASSFNGTTTQFNLTYNSVSQSVGGAEQLIVSLNGVIQEPLSAYTLGIGGSAIVFASAPQSGDTCHIVLFGGVGGTVTPSDQSVTVEKLAAELKDYYEDEFTASGGTTYTLSREAYSDSSLLVSIDGIVQPTSAYDASGTTLTISPALPNGTNIRVIHMGVKAGVYVPQTGTVGLNELNLSSVDSRYYTETEVDSEISTAVSTKADISSPSFTGNVGINVSNPGDFYSGSNDLVVRDGLSIYSPGSSTSRLEFVDGTSGSDAYIGNIVYDHSGNFMRFNVNVSERMRIDSSGNLIVGNTSANTFGVTLNAGNYIYVKNNDDITAFFDRQNGDGDIVLFRKNGSTVGSIGVTGGDNVNFSATAANHGGIMFSDAGSSQPTINPCSAGSTLADGALNIGGPTFRFKDLYLSGGVYLGGTGAANYFDDYEEGTWTPVVGGGSVSVNGYYVKIGRLVHVVCTINNSTLSGASTVAVTGLPFTNGNRRSMTSAVAHYRIFNQDNVVGIVLQGTSRIDFVSTRANSGWEGANFQNSGNVYLHFTATYYTDY